MKLGRFIKEKFIAILLIIFSLVTIEIFLLPFNYENIYMIKIYIPVVIILTFVISIGIEYIKKKTFYNSLNNSIEDLEQKYLINEIIENPNFIEGKILKSILKEIDKSMIENVNKYKYMQEEYKDYIELWIHEVKIPISTSKMIIENNKNEITNSIDEEINKIDEFIEQALFYARSNTVEKDYNIKKTNLKEVVNSVIKKNKSVLIYEKIKINIHDIEREVYTDNKWLNFILNQIIVNSTKYSKEDGEIEIFSIEYKNKVELVIKDTGIGILDNEKTRVFEKGFTGTNGRISGKKSTGIGLYLCKKLCQKLGIGIELNSIYNEGTTVKITFPTNSYILFK